MKKAVRSSLVIILIISCVLTGCNLQSEKSIYSESQNWAYLGVGENKPVDLFLIAPTVYRGNDNSYNMSLENNKIKEKFIGSLNMERGIYEDNCRMYAPYYRQVGLNILNLKAKEAQPYINLAYNDVREAFSYYMDHYNNGRPVILAGFSQGSQMSLRLLKEFFGQKELDDLLVAAYLIGWRVTEDDINEYPHLKMAQGENDTGVIVTFNSEAPCVQSSIIVPKKTLSINPLNWKTTSEKADKSLNIEAVFTNYKGEIIKEVPNLCGAYIDPVRGTLKITDITPDDYPPILGIFKTGVYHAYDYEFFYQNLKENVKVRIDSWFE